MLDEKNALLITIGTQSIRLSTLSCKAQAKISEVNTANRGVEKVLLGTRKDILQAGGYILAEDFSAFRLLINANIGNSVAVTVACVTFSGLILSEGIVKLDESSFLAEFSLDLEGA